MLLILILVFVGVFIVCALLLMAGGTGESQQAERAIANLDAALASGRTHNRDQIVDIRKNEILSAIPLVNRWLMRLELAPRLKVLLYQSGLKWTAGSVLLMSVTCFAIPAYLIYLRTGFFLVGMIVGIPVSFLPLAFVYYKRGKRFDQIEQELPEALDLM